MWWSFTILGTLVGIWHVWQTAKTGSPQELAAVATAWLLAFLTNVIITAGIPVPNPLSLLFRLFGGLATLLTNW